MLHLLGQKLLTNEKLVAIEFYLAQSWPFFTFLRLLVQATIVSDPGHWKAPIFLNSPLDNSPEALRKCKRSTWNPPKTAHNNQHKNKTLSIASHSSQAVGLPFTLTGVPSSEVTPQGYRKDIHPAHVLISSHVALPHATLSQPPSLN